METYRKLPTLISASENTSCAATVQQLRSEEMDLRAAENIPLTEEELDGIVDSIKNICPRTHPISFTKLRTLLQEVSHLSHKEWDRTEKNAERLGKILLGNSVEDMKGVMSSPPIRQMFERILREGSWDAAAEHRRSSSGTPWAVLVTGVNGIRKTTSMYQPWFSDVLQEALISPILNNEGNEGDINKHTLPNGNNSFFRQLDHMIATLCNEEFTKLYSLTGQQLLDDTSALPSIKQVQKYSDLKAAIFTRYRTLSELLGVVLLKEAQMIHSNCLLETSGRDVAMFHYVDHFFPTLSTENKQSYRKLALHFQINNLELAKKSVDKRMVGEIQSGIDAVPSVNYNGSGVSSGNINKDSDITTTSVFDIINANVGGPYGSDVLEGIQEQSDRVWKECVLDSKATVGRDWYKATIQINAFEEKPWTAQAVCSDGSLGKEFEFTPPKVIV